MSLSPGSYEMGRHKQCIVMIYQGHNKVTWSVRRLHTAPPVQKNWSKNRGKPALKSERTSVSEILLLVGASSGNSGCQHEGFRHCRSPALPEGFLATGVSKGYNN